MKLQIMQLRHLSSIQLRPPLLRLPLQRLPARVLAHDVALPAADALFQVVLCHALPLQVEVIRRLQVRQALADQVRHARDPAGRHVVA